MKKQYEQPTLEVVQLSTEGRILDVSVLATPAILGGVPQTEEMDMTVNDYEAW